jgi:hypothetical protein
MNIRPNGACRTLLGQPVQVDLRIGAVVNAIGLRPE